MASQKIYTLLIGKPNYLSKLANVSAPYIAKYKPVVLRFRTVLTLTSSPFALQISPSLHSVLTKATDYSGP